MASQFLVTCVRPGTSAQDRYNWTPLCNKRGSGWVLCVGVIEQSLNVCTTHYNRIGMTT